MPLSDLPKLWTEPTKIGHIFRKQTTEKIEIFKKFHLTCKGHDTVVSLSAGDEKRPAEALLLRQS